MQVFDFTNGQKGELLGNIKIANSKAGWLVTKNDKVYKVELANAVPGWEWHSGATYLRYENNEPVEDVQITPEMFGVEAICFCTGCWKIGTNDDGTRDEQWQWTVLGTTEWNRNSCKNGILKATFSHNK